MEAKVPAAEERVKEKLLGNGYDQTIWHKSRQVSKYFINVFL